MASTMISVNLPENSQDSSQSALELLRPDPPLEQKAEAKIQGNLLKGIDNGSGRAIKGVRVLWKTSFIDNFSLCQLEKKPITYLQFFWGQNASS
jgi:hypothetical protein